jgi:hypothetical protein
MKCLLLCLLLVAGVADAKVVGVMLNNGGKYTYATDEQANCNKGWFLIYFVKPSGEVFRGCWSPYEQDGERVVHVWWSDGTEYFYPLRAFRDPPNAAPQQQNNKYY